MVASASLSPEADAELVRSQDGRALSGYVPGMSGLGSRRTPKVRLIRKDNLDRANGVRFAVAFVRSRTTLPDKALPQRSGGH